MNDGIIKSILNTTDKIIEDTLRKEAQPPIKGKITKGKIKWRGIKKVEKRNEFHHEEWLEQRGRQIGPKIVFELCKL